MSNLLYMINIRINKHIDNLKLSPPQSWSVNPPNTKSFTLTRVTEGPLKSHRAWNMDAFQPCSEAR